MVSLPVEGVDPATPTNAEQPLKPARCTTNSVPSEVFGILVMSEPKVKVIGELMPKVPSDRCTSVAKFPNPSICELVVTLQSEEAPPPVTVTDVALALKPNSLMYGSFR